MMIVLFLLIPVLAVILYQLFGKQRKLLEKIAVASAFLECIFAGYIISQVVACGQYAILPYFSVNALNALVLGITAIISLVATCHGVGYFEEELKKKTIDTKGFLNTYILMRLFVLFMYVAILTANPIILWISVEATTLAIVFLINFFKRAVGLEAAWKFLILNSVGLLLGLLGTLLFLTQGNGVGNGAFIQWHDLLAVAHLMNPQVLKFAFIFILVGYGTKMGLVPMHTWLPDAHSQAPSPISSLLSGALINVAFLAILRFSLITNIAIGSSFTSTLFVFFGVISVVLAGSIIFSQKNYKRLLAYSTIEHSGLLLLGFGFGGIGMFGSLLQMIYHGLAKALFFLLSSNVAQRYNTSLTEHVKGMLKTLPITSILFLFAALFLTGIPPFGMFFSEFYILSSGISHHIVLTGIVMLFLVLVFVGFFRTVTSMVFSTAPSDIKQGESQYWTIIPVGILAIALVVIGIYIPGFLLQLLNQSVSIMMQK